MSALEQPHNERVKTQRAEGQVPHEHHGCTLHSPHLHQATRLPFPAGSESGRASKRGQTGGDG